MNFIGIDIGGTQIKGAVIDINGNILYEARVNTDILLGRESITKGLDSLISDLLSRHSNVLAIGIGTAGRIDTQNGVVAYATDNLPGWRGFDLKKYIEDKFNIKTVIENDANVALIGEVWQGIGRNYNNIVMLTLGTGVGGANIVNGKMLNGKHFCAGEWGHVVLYPNGKQCNCGQKGCIEQYLSGTALVNRVKGLGYNISHGSEIFDLINNGNIEVKLALDEYLDDLTIVIHNINLSFDPELVIIGGGVVESKDNWWSILEEKINLNPQIQCNVKPAILGNKAGVYGACKIAINSLLD